MGRKYIPPDKRSIKGMIEHYEEQMKINEAKFQEYLKNEKISAEDEKRILEDDPTRIYDDELYKQTIQNLLYAEEKLERLEKLTEERFDENILKKDMTENQLLEKFQEMEKAMEEEGIDFNEDMFDTNYMTEKINTDLKDEQDNFMGKVEKEKIKRKMYKRERREKEKVWKDPIKDVE